MLKTHVSCAAWSLFRECLKSIVFSQLLILQTRLLHENILFRQNNEIKFVFFLPEIVKNIENNTNLSVITAMMIENQTLSPQTRKRGETHAHMKM